MVSSAMAKPMLAVKLLIKSNTGITINLFNGLTNAYAPCPRFISFSKFMSCFFNILKSAGPYKMLKEAESNLATGNCIFMLAMDCITVFAESGGMIHSILPDEKLFFATRKVLKNLCL